MSVNSHRITPIQRHEANAGQAYQHAYSSKEISMKPQCFGIYRRQKLRRDVKPLITSIRYRLDTRHRKTRDSTARLRLSRKIALSFELFQNLVIQQP